MATSKFSPKHEIQGIVIKAERKDGENQTTGREWHALFLTISEPVQGKWDSTEKGYTTRYTEYSAAIFGKDEDIDKASRLIRARVIEMDSDNTPFISEEGSTILVRGWPVQRRYQQDGEWKTAKELEIVAPEIDWAHFHQHNQDSDNQQDSNAVDEFDATPAPAFMPPSRPTPPQQKKPAAPTATKPAVANVINDNEDFF